MHHKIIFYYPRYNFCIYYLMAIKEPISNKTKTERAEEEDEEEEEEVTVLECIPIFFY